MRGAGMRKVSIAGTLLALLLALITVPSAVVADSPQNSGPDESIPIMKYCTPDIYACEGYVAAAPEQYMPPWVPGFRNYQGFYHNDLSGIYRFPSYAISIKRDATGQATSVTKCSDVSASDCNGDEVSYVANLPLCSVAIDMDCIRDLVATDSSGKRLDIVIEGEFPKGNPSAFLGSLNLKVPNGAAPTLIHIPSAPHAGGDTYLIKVEQKGARQIKYSPDFMVRSLIASVTAVKIIDGKYAFGGVSTDAKLYLPNFDNIGDNVYPSLCAIASNTQCAARYSIPTGLRFGMTIDLSNKITGWLHGRVKAPTVDVSSNKAGGTTLSVLAESIKIPVNAVWVNNDNAPQSVKNFYAGKPNYGSPTFGNENKSRPLNEINLMRDANSGHNQETVDEYLAWLSALGDKAQALPSAWVVQTMSNYQVSDQIQKCLNQTDSLAGIVTTNAAEYLDGPPVYDKVNRALDYKVAATHFESDGTTVFRGSYDLIMSSKVARCIYGFTNAPVNATISVTSENGENNVATTVISEKNGWLSLGAYNFTYSSPIIRVVLDGTVDVPTPTPTPTPTPSIVATPTPSAVATPQPTASAKKPLVVKTTCVKGKITKVVTGTKCPTGYKKK